MEILRAAPGENPKIRPPLTAEDVLAVLSRFRISGPTEAVIQARIEQALKTAEVEHQREVELSPKDRIDFMVDSVGVEVKIQGTRAEIIRQLSRYIHSDRVTEIVLAASSRRLLSSIPDVILDAKIHKHLLQGGLL